MGQPRGGARRSSPHASAFVKHRLMAASARRQTPMTAATSATPRRRLLPTPTPRPARRAALPDAALSPGGALRRDLEAATSVARRLVAALSGGEQPSPDAALPDLLREAASRAAELRSAAMHERGSTSRLRDSILSSVFNAFVRAMRCVVGSLSAWL